jgi:hypothetical protein
VSARRGRSFGWLRRLRRPTRKRRDLHVFQGRHTYSVSHGLGMEDPLGRLTGLLANRALARSSRRTLALSCRRCGPWMRSPITLEIPVNGPWCIDPDGLAVILAWDVFVGPGISPNYLWMDARLLGVLVLWSLGYTFTCWSGNGCVWACGVCCRVLDGHTLRLARACVLVLSSAEACILFQQ